MPLEHPPGHAQADFGEAIGIIGGVERKIHFLHRPAAFGCFFVALSGRDQGGVLRRHAIRVEAIRAPVVEDQQVGLGERSEEPWEAAVTVRQLEVGEQPRHAGVMHAVAVAAGLLCQRAGQPRLADPAWAGDEQIAMLGDPTTAT